MSLLFLTDLIKRAGLEPEEIKLIRHALSDKVFKQYFEMGKVKEYTQHQRKEFSKGYKYWMVFISDGGSLARFEGLYMVLDEKSDIKENMPDGCPDVEAFKGEASIFLIEKMDILDILQAISG